MPYAAARIDGVAFPARDDMHMEMEDCLARRLATIDADVVAIDGAMLRLDRIAGGSYGVHERCLLVP